MHLERCIIADVHLKMGTCGSEMRPLQCYPPNYPMLVFVLKFECDDEKRV